MDQLSSIISRLGPSLLRKLFECGRDEPVRTFDEFEKGITRICRGAKRPLAIREAAVQAMWAHMLKHCVDPDEGIEINEILLAFAVRDYTALKEKREQFNELTQKLLGEEGCRPLRRRYSTTFVGFGPSAVPDGSPATLGLSQTANNGGRLSISMASPKGNAATRRNTGVATPPPIGEPPFGMSAYAMRRANMTPTSSVAMGHGFAQRQPSLDGDLGNSLEDQHGGRSFVSHVDPSEEVDNGSSKMQSPSGKSPASKAPPGNLPTK
jgi:Arc/MetJ family transcription regulator